MSYSADLRIVGSLPEATDVPAHIEQASIALNHGLLVGDLLGVVIGEAQRVLEAVSAREDPILMTREMQVLRDTYGAVRTALDLAMSPDGVPLDNPAGERLRSSPLLETDAAGTLAIRHRRLPLPELKVRLVAIDHLLCHALAHHGAICLEPA